MMKMMITTTTIFADSNLGARLGLAPFCPRGQSPFPLGLRVHTNSLLPKGSGLGGSSILALACARAIAGACALRLTSDEEMNTVLGVEQVLGTGGGWQGPRVWFMSFCVSGYQCACGTSAYQATELPGHGVGTRPRS